MNNVNENLAILFDKEVDEGGRDDIAMDLYSSDEPTVLEALLTIASDENDNEIVRDSCIESLAQILARNKNNSNYLNSIGIVNLHKALKIIKIKKTNLYNDCELNDLE